MRVQVQTSGRSPRQPPFQEMEWDMRLDSMLQDLQSSAQSQSQSQVQQHQFYQRQQFQSVSHISSSGGKQQQQHQVKQHQQQRSEHSYPLVKSQSEGSLHESTGAMLKDLDSALKASTNYIETHRTVRDPSGTREYHEVRSYSSGGDRRPDPGDFNLERQVEHMIPLGAPSPSLDRHYSALQSANMMSSVQQQKTTSYSTYKVQSNQYSTSGERVTQVDYSDEERPGSRLKQNINELDTLLSDLNNAKTPANSHHVSESDDYSLSDSGLQGHVKRTVSSFNEYNYQTNTSGQQSVSGGDYYGRKPPSPSPGRRRAADSPGPAIQPSPVPLRMSSPGPASGAAVTSSSSYNYNLRQTTSELGSDHRYPDYGSGAPTNNRSPSPYCPPSEGPRLSSPSPSGPRAPRDATPTGVNYYSKYHSILTHQSQKSSGPMAFPTSTASPHHHGGHQGAVQSPPKRVDELMSELADFDPSIQPSDIAEPQPSRPRQQEPRVTIERHDDDFPRRQRRSPSPVRPAKQASTPGPPVYYPPGEVFSSARSQPQTGAVPPQPAPAAAAAEQSAADGGRAQMRREYGYKDKGRGGESDSKGGAAVVPICLPLCCAAPCVIL